MVQSRILGKDLEVSAVGLVCMGFAHAYGTAMDEKEADKAIVEAVEMGYTFLIRRNVISAIVRTVRSPVMKIWSARR